MKKTMAKVLDDLSSELATEAKRLSDIRELLKIEQGELTEFREKGLTHVAIETLIQEFEDKKLSLENGNTKLRLELDREIEIKQGEWDDQVSERKRADKSYQQERAEKNRREEDEYNYKFKQKCKIENDGLTEKATQFELEISEKKVAFENELKEREFNIRSNEDELMSLKKKQEHHEKELARSIESTSIELSEKLGLKYKHELELLKQSKIASESIFQNRVESLESYVEKQDQQIDLLNVKLESSSTKVQEIAAKAIEGASGAGTLGTVNRIALEQAKHRPTTGDN